MSAETENLDDAATQQLILGTSPEFNGIQVAPDQNKLAQLVAELRRQQYLNSVPGQTGAGDLSFLANRGGRDAAAVGSSLGSLLGNALGGGQAPPVAQPQPIQTTGPGPGIALPTAGGSTDLSALSNPNAPLGASSPQATVPQGTAMQAPPAAQSGPLSRDQQLAAVKSANALYQQLVSSGMDPDQASLTATKTLLNTGIPGVAQKVVAAQQQILANQFKRAETSKDVSQGNAADDEISNRSKIADRELKQNTWTDTGQGNANYKTQVNGLGEERRIELAPQPNAAALSQANLNPDNVKQFADAVADGRVAPPSASLLRTPYGQAVQQQLLADHPDYDAKNYPTMQKAQKDFATGKQGDSVRSFNVALSHLDTLNQAGSALQNGDTPALNQIANTVAKWTGKAPPVTFDAIKGIVGDELTKAIVGSHGALADREEMKAQLSAANSPAAMNDVIAKYQSLMAGQLAGLRTQYETSGLKNFEGKLEPRARDIAHNAPEYNSVFPNTSADGSTTAAPPAVHPGQTATPPSVQALLDKYKS